MIAKWETGDYFSVARLFERDASHLLSGLEHSSRRRVHKSTSVIRLRSANTMQHIFTNRAIYIRVGLPGRFSQLAVFDARFYI
jgi:hypothetical protein